MDYQTPRFFRVVQYARRADRDVIDMVSGSPDWDPPAGIRDGLREYADFPADDFQYLPSDGLPELRDHIAARRGVDRDRVIVTNGAGEANHLAVFGGLERFSGNEILLTDPVFPYYAGRAHFLDADVGFVPVEEQGHLDPERVRERASEETAVIVVNTPNNPTGAVYDADVMERLVEIAEVNDALLVSDEVYDHFDYTGRFSSAVEIDSPNVVATNSFSKAMAITGLRVGYAIFPPEDGPTGDLLERARTRHMLTNVTGSRPAQYAVLRALKTTGPEYYADIRDRLRERIDTFCETLEAAGAEYDRPEGGFYVMARFDGYDGHFDHAYELIDEAGVAGMPGQAFGDSRSEWFRFALMTPRVDEAADRLAAFFSR
ncbi:aminotransferase class I/II-fold pyridoxal phosphate-dependent enzyme [Halomicrobium mukohataei]|uniref:Aminotransferase n=1 Tax=Halomicrobium mukohataei TaxID=57705 RepID=A0A847UG96_9EURY|nr:pyridoxal phosphate-dependent aminotransferase [Halomicrobium mukohataei]NLV11267.1 aminotransferase class I/II-fold pyridoxal phosphate-dependent enzyme [Halomicrobium mukohataei]